MKVDYFECGYCGSVSVKKGDVKCKHCGAHFNWEATKIYDEGTTIVQSGANINFLAEKVYDMVSKKLLREIVVSQNVIRTIPFDKSFQIQPIVPVNKTPKMDEDGNFDVQMVILGVSNPCDYIGIQNRQKRKDLEDAKKEMLITGERSLFKRGIDERKWDSNGVILDNRKKIGDRENRKYGLPIVDSSYISKVIGFFESPSDGSLHFFEDLIGGEMNDEPVRMKCSSCGETSIFSTCPKCNTRKEGFVLEYLSRNAFKYMRTRARYLGNEKTRMIWRSGALDVTSQKFIDRDMISWMIKTREFSGRKVTAKNMQDILKSSKRPETGDPTSWVYATGRVIDKWHTTSSYTRCFNIIKINDIEGEMIEIHVPEHVWEFMMCNDIDIEEEIIVFGSISSTPTFNQETNTIDRVHRKTIIDAWGINCMEEWKARRVNINEIDEMSSF